MGRPRALYTEDEVRCWHQDYEAGMTAPDIAAKYFVSTMTVYNYFHRLGLPLRPPSRPKAVYSHPERDSAMAKDYRRGMTKADIGRKYGLTKERVGQILARQGIPRQPKFGSLSKKSIDNKSKV